MPDAALTIVIFGASGDLGRRKLVPALFKLHRKGRLPPRAVIVGFSRRAYDPDGFRGLMESAVAESLSQKPDAAAWNAFAEGLHYVAGDVENPSDFRALDDRLRALEGGASANRLYYLAIAPDLYPKTIAHLGAAGMAREEGAHRRAVIEKPFGRDLDSARRLNEVVHAVFEERQVYRIDHYLGKETAQSILFFRFGNTVFEPLWNRSHVDHVQLSVLESVGVGHRGGFYDGVGVVRDIFQNHLLQLLALVAMEPPDSFDADSIRDEKAKVLSSVRPPGGGRVALDSARGQYQGYRAEEGIDPSSTTATYAALKLHLDNPRWRGVPFYLRSGKSLEEKVSEIVIAFRRPPHSLFPRPEGTPLENNYLAICVQPDEGMHLRFDAKVPDTQAELRPVDMEFHYAEDFEGIEIPEAYERLLLDAIHGDPSLFDRSDTIELSWKIVDPVLSAWDTPDAPPLEIYPRESLGPDSAERLLSRDGRSWLRGCGRHSRS
jgi:glucose-6-phosphate 1-dehydrogenase